MSSFEFPDGQPVTDAQSLATPAWRQTFSRWHTIILSVQQSGTTAQRPTVVLWVGRRFFDTTLGKPVYLKTATPRVWVDAAGLAV